MRGWLRRLRTFEFQRVERLRDWHAGNAQSFSVASAKDYQSGEWNLVIDGARKVYDNMRSGHTLLGEIASVFVGVQTSADKLFHLKRERAGSDFYLNGYNERVELGSEFLKPIISGKNVSEFLIESTDEFIVFPYEIIDGKPVLVSRGVLKKRSPHTYSYLKAHETTLRGRERGKCDDNEWHRFGRNQNIARQHLPKLCIPRLVTQLEVANDSGGAFVMDNVDVCGLTLKPIFAHLNLVDII